MFGYLLHRLKCEPAPFLLGFVLGDMMEENLRRAMQISRGDPIAMISSPICAVLLGASALLILSMILPMISRGREKLVED